MKGRISLLVLRSSADSGSSISNTLGWVSKARPIRRVDACRLKGYAGNGRAEPGCRAGPRLRRSRSWHDPLAAGVERRTADCVARIDVEKGSPPEGHSLAAADRSE